MDSRPPSVLTAAAALGDAQSVAAIIAGRPEGDASQALMAAAHAGSAECCALLIPLANPKFRSADGETALMRASWAGHGACAAMLASHCDPLAVDFSRASALFGAAAAGHHECVRILLPISRPLAVNDHGDTPLIAAARKGWDECVRLLAPLGGLDIEGGGGQTALEAAAQRGRAEACAIILRASLAQGCSMEHFRAQSSAAASLASVKGHALAAAHISSLAQAIFDQCELGWQLPAIGAPACDPHRL